MKDKKIQNTIKKINEELTDNYLKDLSDEQFDEILKLVEEIDKKLSANE